jgi:hypothetical protein
MPMNLVFRAPDQRCHPFVPNYPCPRINKMQQILRAITQATTAHTRNINKIKLRELVVHHRALSTKEAGKLLHCTKQQRNIAWNRIFGNAQLFGVCMLCYMPNAVNCCYSDMMQLHDAQVFACNRCVNSNGGFPVALICLRTNTIDDLRMRVWLYRNGLCRCALCPCCSKEIHLMESSWHVAHNLASKYGGTDQLSNLFTTCVECNLAMSTNTVQRHLACDEQEKESTKEMHKHQHRSMNVQTEQTVDVCMRLLQMEDHIGDSFASISPPRPILQIWFRIVVVVMLFVSLGCVVKINQVTYRFQHSSTDDASCY